MTNQAHSTGEKNNVETGLRPVSTKTPKIRFPGFDAAWEEKKLEDVSDLISGQHLSPDQYSKEEIGTPYFTGPSDFTNKLSEISKWTDQNTKIALIKDYNNAFGCNYSTDRFYDYYKDLQKRIKNKEIDLILVVNMFLTGFDSPRLNTLYVDKNLRYHGLLQAYSRTNRLLNADKPHGNIVSFRNLKDATDKALQLFGDENAKEVVFKKPYEKQKEAFEAKLAELKEKVPTLESIDELESEEAQAEFIKTFRDLLRIKSSLETFAEFSFEELGISEQEFYEYQSKYLDIYDQRKKEENEQESILDQIDFELELTVRDVVNYDYILKLIGELTNIQNPSVRKKKIADILSRFDRDIQLRKKKELIQKFIEEHLPHIKNAQDAESEFEKYWDQEREKMLEQIAKEEEMPFENLKKLVNDYLYTQKVPRSQQIADKLKRKVSILERESILSRIKNSIIDFVEVFEW